MILNKLYIIRKTIIIESKDNSNIRGIDLEGNEISVNVANKNIPVLKSGVLSGVSILNSNNEIECYINKNKQIMFINVIEETSDAAGETTEKLNNTIKNAALHAGFAQILPDEVTILAEIIEWPDEIDVERAQAAKARAEERLANKTEAIDVQRAELALRRALVRMDIAK